MSTILLVDDNPADRALFRIILGRAGFERAVNLDGGVDARSRDVDPTAPLC